jgi:hypothetical protein
MLNNRQKIAFAGCKNRKKIIRFKEAPINVFPEIKLRGLGSNFYIHISVSDFYIPTIGPPILKQPNKLTDRNKI